MIDLLKLEKAKKCNGKLIAACPACRAEGNDKSGNHLVIFPGDMGFENGKFSCVKHEGDSDHRKTIFSYIGIKENARPLDIQARREYALKIREQERKERKQAELTKSIQDNLEELILAPYITENWRMELFDRSPMHLDCVDAMPHDFLKCLFPLDAVIWMGDVYDAGSERHKANFKTAREWVKLEALPPRIAPAHFKSDSFQRSKDNILERPFLIIECDEIIGFKPVTDTDKERNKQFTAALALYAVDKLKLNLRAVIDTGNKSLHLWFDRPRAEAVEAMRKMIDGFRIDRSPFDHSHIPLRMPNSIHDKTNKPARLLYLNHITNHAI